MPTAEFFTRLGLFIHKNFLDPELCARCCREMNEAAQAQATIAGPDGTDVTDEKYRKVKWADVPAATTSLVETRLLALLPTLERHFNVALTGYEPLSYLIYREGDFFRAHADGNNDADAPVFLKERKVSVVIFLNGQAQQPADDSYCGGSLTFYGLIDDPRWLTYGFPLNSKPGLLIAFRSDVLHQILPVTYGKRYSIVGWLY
jgi:SM-20-related protein